MNQQKTGELIALLRKGKNLTQAELAEQLGVSNKAVSKWETGKGMPDISLLKPLGEILGITVNDLLRGEVMDTEQFKKQADENVLEILSAHLKTKKSKSILYGVIIVLLGLILSGRGAAPEAAGDAALFFAGLSNGLSIGMIVVGLGIVVYGVVKYSEKK